MSEFELRGRHINYHALDRVVTDGFSFGSSVSKRLSTSRSKEICLGKSRSAQNISWSVTHAARVCLNQIEILCNLAPDVLIINLSGICLFDENCAFW